MSTTIQTTKLDDLDLFDDLLKVFTAGPSIEAWLATMWGIRPGQSSPLCQVSRSHRSPEVAAWLRLWGLAPHGGSV